MRLNCDRAWDAAVKYSKAPIVIGPFRSELGFEALYWIPYVLAWRRRLQIASRRIYVITRGGMGHFYGAHACLDAYDLASLEDCRIAQMTEAKQTQMLKQTRVTAFDRVLLTKAAAQWGLKRYHVLHPRRMYCALTPWWEDRCGFRTLIGQTQYESLAPPEIPTSWQLPKEYVAVRFYARATYPPHPDTLRFAEDAVSRIAKHVPVVQITSGLFADDHQDFEFNGPNIFKLPALPAHDNLRLQAGVLARATGFVGTYGGFAQLALRLGVPSVSYYYQFGGTARAHLGLSHYLSLQSGVAFQVLPVGSVPLVRGLLG